jgi:hypothetical protein
MEASLHFTLPDEETAFHAAASGLNAVIVLDELDNRLRSWNKYEGPDKPVTATSAIEAIREMLRELRDEYRIPDIQ